MKQPPLTAPCILGAAELENIKKVNEMKASKRSKNAAAKKSLAGVQTTPQEKMVIRRCGDGSPVRYPGCLHSTEHIRWVSPRKTDAGLPAEIREPQESSRAYPVDWGFVAAGKRYANFSQLCVQHEEGPPWFRDIYGRRILSVAKRFPCFDVFDSMYERRFYHWFFLREGNALTRIFFEDGSGTIYVTEDVANLEQYCLELMEEMDYLDKL